MHVCGAAHSRVLRRDERVEEHDGIAAAGQRDDEAIVRRELRRERIGNGGTNHPAEISL